jgi:cell division protein ZapA
MASLEVEIGTRRYSVACRDGEEEHLRSVAALVDKKARDAETALGNMGEARQLLFAALLLADELKEAHSGTAAPAAPEPQPAQADPGVADALERLAARMEMLAHRLEQAGPNT